MRSWDNEGKRNTDGEREKGGYNLWKQLKGKLTLVPHHLQSPVLCPVAF